MKLALQGNYFAKQILKECATRMDTELTIANSWYSIRDGVASCSKLSSTSIGGDGIRFDERYTRKERLTVYRALKADGIEFTINKESSNAQTYESHRYTFVLINKFN